MSVYFAKSNSKSIPIHVVDTTSFTKQKNKQTTQVKNWLVANKFSGKSDQVCLVPAANGKLEQVWLGLEDTDNHWAIGNVARQLPGGNYRIEINAKTEFFERVAIAWGLANYKYERYLKRKPKMVAADRAKLVLPSRVSSKLITSTIDSITAARDLMITPTDDLGPSEFAKHIRQRANKLGMRFSQITGNKLLEKNYPAIHAVGRASDDAPRIIELTWGNSRHPKLALVGKGVCYDTGGLSIKTSRGMLSMKADMGGAAHALALAELVVQNKLPVQLKVYLPLVENAISGNAYRPGDVIDTRKGLTVEVTNTDAEGRLILCDALARATESKPELIIDFATLTGAVIAALGTEMPGVFANDDTVVNQVIKHCQQVNDPVWQMPLVKNYRKQLNSDIAEIKNACLSGYAGSITAALFLHEFVAELPWLHFDIACVTENKRSGIKYKGDVVAIRGVFDYLQKRYKQK